MDATSWDEMYRRRAGAISTCPNAGLRAETANLAPGRALDVGCGHGADARWLAARGWDVTALDLSRVALDRAVELTEAGASVTWCQGDLVTVEPPLRGFDLVSAQYVPLPRAAGDALVERLLDAVGPGGTLLVVNHDLDDLGAETRRAAAEHYLSPDLVGLLDDRWTVELHERRPRSSPAPEGTRHTHDIVLRARRGR